MKKLDRFEYFNRVKHLNGCLQIILLVSLLFGLQWSLSHYYFRKDFSKDKYNTLSSESKSLLSQLEDSLELIILYDETQNLEDFIQQMSRLAELYRHALPSQKNVQLNFKIIHTLRSPQEALQIKKQYQLIEASGVVLAYKGHYKLLSLEDFYQKEGENSLFLGENVLTNQLLDLIQNHKKIVYWVLGHQEYDYQNVHGSQGASLAGQTLAQHQFEIRPLDNCLEIPEDANIIVIAGPQLAYLEKECENLKHYLFQRHGRLILCLHPLLDHGLNPLLKTLGLHANNVILLDDSKDFINANGSFLIRRLTPHELTQPLIQRNLGLLFGLTRPILADSEQTNTLQLLYSSETSWVHAQSNNETFTFNPQEDVRQSWPLACLFDNTPHTSFNVSLSHTKAVVVGCADWMSNERFLALGNRWFFLNCFRWALDETDTFTLKPVPIPTYKLTLSRQKMLQLCLSFLILPFVLCLLGIVINNVRKE